MKVKETEMGRLSLALLILFPATVASGAEKPAPAFTARPEVKRSNGKVEIGFEVNAFTDVEVAVLDGKGRVVRHLAAGRLGKNAPKPFKKDARKQEISWDRRDDAGKPASGGPFKVRVSLGMRPEIEKYLGWVPKTISKPIVGLCVDPEGRLYVLDRSYDTRHSSCMRVLDRGGKYLRTIMPYPADTPEEQLTSVGRLEVDGRKVPVVYSGHDATIHPLMTGLQKRAMVWSPKGHLLTTSGVGTKEEHGMPRHLVALAPEGGAPKGRGFLGPRIRKPANFLGGAGERNVGWFDYMATDPKGEWIYLNQAGSSRRFKRAHGVFRLKWTGKLPAEPFLGKREAGVDDAHFKDPRGIAVDAEGRLYVCDRGNNRVVVFDDSGKRLGEFRVEHPEQIAVHPAGGEIYLVSRRAGRAFDLTFRSKEPVTSRLLKLSPFGKGKVRELARLDFQVKKRVVEVMALDASAKPPKLWLALYTGWMRPHMLQPVADRGGKLELGKSVIGQAGLEGPLDLAADVARGRLIVRDIDRVGRRRRFFTVDLNTGKKRLLKLGGRTAQRQGPPIALDRSGNIYVAGDFCTTLICERFDPAGKPLPFAGTGSHQIKREGTNPHWSRGIAVGDDGSVYVLRNIVRHHAAQVDVYGPDGKLRKAKLISGVGRGANGLGVDSAGNLYLGVNVKPRGRPYPPEFAGKVPGKAWWFWYKGKYFSDRPEPWTGTYYNPYLYHWGSVVKFGPEGGGFWGLRSKPRKGSESTADVSKAPAGSSSFVTGCLEREVRVSGARWARQGFGIVANSVMKWGDPGCCCSNAGFCVDPYGRAYYPNPFRFCVEVIDAGANLITRAGTYGNADDGPASAKATAGKRQPGRARSEIFLAWPTHTAWADGRLFVSDGVNQRIVAIKLKTSAVATCAVP
jgi:hypothetical protein